MKAVLSIIAVTAVAAGCKSVERFDTGSDSVYCLDQIGEPVAESGLVPNDSDAGVPPSLEAGRLAVALTIDAQQLASRPGKLWSNDAEFGICHPQPSFDGVPMRTIQESLRDAVSAVQLTPDHVQDIFLWIDSTCQSTFVGILSLIDGGSVELRLFKPRSALAETGPAELRSSYSVFARSRRQSSCGF